MTTTTLRARRLLFGSEEPEWLVWLLVIFLLAIGLLVRGAVLGRTESVSEGNVTISYPAGWTVLSPGANQLLAVSEPIESSLFPATVTVTQVPVTSMSDSGEVTLGDLALKWSNDHSQDLDSYQVLGLDPVKVRGQDAVKVRYVFVTEPALAGPNTIPVVAEGEDVLIRKGEALTAIALVADANEFEAVASVWNRILSSIELK